MRSLVLPFNPDKRATSNSLNYFFTVKVLETKNNIPGQDPNPNAALGRVCNLYFPKNPIGPKDFSVLITNGLGDLNKLVMKYMELINKHFMYQSRAEEW
jgi:hypothetical protein